MDEDTRITIITTIDAIEGLTDATLTLLMNSNTY